MELCRTEPSVDPERGRGNQCVLWPAGGGQVARWKGRWVSSPLLPVFLRCCRRVPSNLRSTWTRGSLVVLLSALWKSSPADQLDQLESNGRQHRSTGARGRGVFCVSLSLGSVMNWIY